ncbi:PTS system IIB component, Glc family /PTS system IIC component, Glc family [Aeromonas sp. RU39B]|uniref:PTS transporter subunit EIIC n=1 Tax=Aeromonas sp. RU39B TaxID=1907416 RepID=UPI000955CFC0|nr:PTS transporter subunit EIIC [Aeromonas sp. RU39B]SIQ63834.1 PTS system IIB component, Glc family /PTS system IIC component, Glc family [Aeromonas sp. RU39B]
MQFPRSVAKNLQRLGYALLLPVSLLPVAALMNRLGEHFLPELAIAGHALFSQMPLIYAIAIAFGLSRDGHGSQALAGAVGYLLLSSGVDGLHPGLHADMICGILVGVTTAICWPFVANRRLPGLLGHLPVEVPATLASALVCLLLVLPMALVWPHFEHGIVLLAQDMIDSPLGTFCYGMLNRLLIPLGLHQVLGSLVGIGTGDLETLQQSIPPYSEFVAGLYPIIMFGLPGATFAIWLHRQREGKPEHGGLMLTLALTSALLGITEPIEFLFAFTAPRLFITHAVLTGISFALCNEIGIQVGSYFSAGLLDLLLCAPSGHHAFWLIPIGILFFVCYAIVFWLLLEEQTLAQITPQLPHAPTTLPSSDPQMLAIQYLKTLGGLDNLQAMSVCLTRLSLRVCNMNLVDQRRLPELGCLSWMVVSDQQLVLVLGPNATPVEAQIRMLASRQSVPLGQYHTQPSGQIV